MMTPKQAATITDTADRTFTVSRVFDAPRALVFAAFSKPEHLVHWWGPNGWTLPVCTVDFRPGGIWHYCMRGPNGEESWGRTVYREIVEPERIVSVDSFSDAEGNIVAGMPEMLITLTFEEHDGKTTLTNHAQFASEADLAAVMEMGMVAGLTQTWDRLEAYLATA